MFESWKRKMNPKAEVTPQDIADMKDNRAKAMLAASVGALGVTMANQAEVKDLHVTPDKIPIEHVQQPHEAASAQQLDKAGTTVSIDSRQNVVTVNMRQQTYTAHERPDGSGTFDVTKDKMPGE